jgi:hypothetical protein
LLVPFASFTDPFVPERMAAPIHIDHSMAGSRTIAD